MVFTSLECGLCNHEISFVFTQKTIPIGRSTQFAGKKYNHRTPQIVFEFSSGAWQNKKKGRQQPHTRVLKAILTFQMQSARKLSTKKCSKGEKTNQDKS